MTTVHPAPAVSENAMKALSSAIALGNKAQVSERKAIDMLFDSGIRSEHILKSGEQFSELVYSSVEEAIIKGKFTAAEQKIVTMTSEQAKASGASALRTPLTKIISAYFGNLRGALDRRAIDAGEKPAPEKKAKAVKADAVADAPESGDSTETVQKDVAGVQPGRDLASYKEALNMMLIAARCHLDARVMAVADRHCEVFTAMLQELKS